MVAMMSAFASRLRSYRYAAQSLIVLTFLITVTVNLWGLLAGVTIVLPHLFYIPIVLAAFFYPRRGLIFSLGVSACYFLMVILILPSPGPELIQAGSRCVIFVFIAAIVSYLSEQVETKERLLVQAETDWENTFNGMPDLIAIIGTDHRIHRINRAMAERLGISPGQAVGMQCYEVVHASGTIPGACPHAMLLRDGKEHTEEIHEDRLGGDLLVTTAPIRDATGNLTGSVHIARNITERKRIENALRESEEKYRSIINEMQDIFYRTDISGKIVMLSPSAAKLAGYDSPDQLVGQDVTMVYADPADREKLVAAMKETGSVYAFPVDLRVRDGSIRHVTTSSHFYRDARGTILGIEGVIHDITQLRNAEDALRVSEERYRTIIENIQDVYFRFDQESRLVMVSPSAGPMFGYASAGEMIGLPAASLWEDPEAREQMIETMKNQGGFVRDWEAELKKRDGTVFWASISGHLHLDKDGRYLGKEGIIRDITERKKMEVALKAALEKLNMLSSITRHDILNQVMGLRTFLELSREDLKGTQYEANIEKEDEIARAIQRQIEFTKYYQDVGVKAPKWHETEAVIREAAQELDLSSVTLSIGIHGVEIFADPLIVKVFFNLMENSLRHGEHVTEMSFSSRTIGKGLVITYRDNGVGIPPKDRENLFRKGFGKHTGLGLFLSREILAITGITITENGEPGKGVQFEITVPYGAFRAM